ncbi:MAG: ImcF-related family protein [Paracoccaceae bacterium]
MPAAPPDLYDRLAEPVLAYAERLGEAEGEEMGALLRQAATLLERFSSDALRQGVVPSTVPPARLALALILDNKARGNRRLDIKPWAAGAHRLLFDGREVSSATLRDFIRRAADAGHDFDGVRRFLERCLDQLEGDRLRYERDVPTNWTGITVVLVAAFLLSVVSWAAYVEWRFHRELTRVFDAEAVQIGLDRAGDIPDLAARLDRLQAAAARVVAQASDAPIRLAASTFGFDAGTRAEGAYQAALARHLPDVLAGAIDTAIATDGDAVALYDTLRAWSVLSGTDEWSPAWVAGWAGAREAADPTLAGLAPHVLRLAAPARPSLQPDPELLDQATAFAADAPEADRAFLELERSEAARDLPSWTAEAAIPGMTALFERRSGASLAAPVPGLFTAAGWDMARTSGAGLAVQKARDEAARLFSPPPQPRNDTPDTLLGRLQSRTLDIWSTFLDDLRVAPFSSADRAVLISGGLSSGVSPIEAVVREIWHQAGGDDPRRTHDMQLAVTYRFGSAIDYIEDGRMREITDLFARLNVALASSKGSDRDTLETLMSVQDRSGSIRTLDRAPRAIVGLVEDTLAQAGSAHADRLTNPLTRAWQAEALAACGAALDGRFPFAAEGPDADLAALARFLAPGGVLDRFQKGRVADYIDTGSDPWKWKPAAKFEGLSADSAAFFQRAAALSAGLIGKDGAVGADFHLHALADKGKAHVTLGGDGGAVDTTSDELALSWPGRDPALGIDVLFEAPEGKASLAAPGPWGMMHLLEPLRLRERDGGKRFLIDLRSGGARVFVAAEFANPANPLSLRGIARGLTCPQTL